jgi:DME family drug/metabolite transporter
VPLLPLLTSATAAAGIVYLGLLTTCVAYWLFASGVGNVGVPVAITLSLLEPVAATALGAFVAHETPGAVALCGVLVTVTALAVLAVNGAPVRQSPGDDGRMPAVRVRGVPRHRPTSASPQFRGRE